jgi:hypothetical protein
MSEIRYYKGKFKVEVLARSRGHWVVKACEGFQDVIHGEEVNVMAGAERIVPPNLLFKRRASSQSGRARNIQAKK